MNDETKETLIELRKVAKQSLAFPHASDCWKYHYACAITKACDLAESLGSVPPVEKIGDADKVNDFYDWLAYGVNNGYCSEQVCSTHAGVPLSDKEMDDDNGDFCIHVVRLGTPEDWDAEFSEGEDGE